MPEGRCQSNLADRARGCYRRWMSRRRKPKPHDPFRYFQSSPEVIGLVVMMYVRFPLSLRNVEDLLFERGIDLCHDTVRHWWNRFGPMFAADVRQQRVSRMRVFTHWKWHLDEMCVTRRAAKLTSMARWFTCGARSITRTRSSRAS
jgi:transposase-like protein